MKEIISYLEKNISQKRLSHILAVKKECERFADIYELTQKNRQRLITAALLHDITKEKTLDEQKELCRVYNIELSSKDIVSNEILHQFTGAEFSLHLFPHLCDSATADIIRTHTTGGVNMTLEQKILCLCDMIEETRPHKACKKLREYYYTNPENLNKYALLDITLLRSLDSTISHLTEKGLPVDKRTIEARNYLMANTRCKYERS